MCVVVVVNGTREEENGEAVTHFQPHRLERAPPRLAFTRPLLAHTCILSGV